jgi:hypothetical protein
MVNWTRYISSEPGELLLHVSFIVQHEREEAQESERKSCRKAYRDGSPNNWRDGGYVGYRKLREQMVGMKEEEESRKNFQGTPK